MNVRRCLEPQYRQQLEAIWKWKADQREEPIAYDWAVKHLPDLTLTSANVASLLPHLDYTCSLDADAIAMHELGLTEDAIKITNDLIVPYKVKALCRPQPIRRGTMHGTLDAKLGGVYVIWSQTHAAVPSPRTALGNNPYDRGRWQSLATNVNTGGLIVHVVTLYGFPRANEGGDAMEQNEDFLADAFAEASSLGNTPVLVLGGLQYKGWKVLPSCTSHYSGKME